jgi:GcrA cell cycle regulator
MNETEKPWTDQEADRLCVMWAAGLTGSQIGKELKRSPHSVIKKARRLKLPGRPSPIRTGKPKEARRLTGSTLPPLASLS